MIGVKYFCKIECGDFGHIPLCIEFDRKINNYVCGANNCTLYVRVKRISNKTIII